MEKRERDDRAKNPSVLIGFTEISGYFHNLARGLDDQGYRCDFLELVPHPFRYRDEVPSGGLIVTSIRALRGRAEMARFPALQAALALTSRLLMVPLFLSSVVRYDVFVFTYGNSFFAANLDLILLRLLRKRVVMPFLGSEARARYLDGFVEFSSLDELHASTQQQHRKIRFIERHADVIINNPAAGHLLERPFVNFFRLGIPQDCRGSSSKAGAGPPGGDGAARPSSDGAPVRILHTPSARRGKGSDEIRKIVQRLGTRHQIEYTEISNRPHAEVLERIRESDLVVDQVYSDTPMAAFASEAACYGIPAVVGGYYAATIADDVDRELMPPSRYVLPEELESAIESLVVDPEVRRELGQRARRFAETRWSRAEVASRYARILCGDIPGEWWFDPGETHYLYGCGLSRDQAASRISAVIEAYGTEALQLGRKRELLRRFEEFGRR